MYVLYAIIPYFTDALMYFTDDSLDSHFECKRWIKLVFYGSLLMECATIKKSLRSTGVKGAKTLLLFQDIRVFPFLNLLNYTAYQVIFLPFSVSLSKAAINNLPCKSLSVQFTIHLFFLIIWPLQKRKHWFKISTLFLLSLFIFLFIPLKN